MGAAKFFVLADIIKTAEAWSPRRRMPPGRHWRMRQCAGSILTFDAERALNGLGADIRLALRRTHVAPLVTEFENWMRLERAKFSRFNDIAKAMDYMLKRCWTPSPASLTMAASVSRIMPPSGRCAVSRSAAATGPSAALTAAANGAAAIYSLIATAKLNDIDPEAWLADVLRRINDHPAAKLDELFLPWHWRPPERDAAAA